MQREAGKRGKRLGVFLVTLGCGLLAVSALGVWTHLGNYRNYPPRPWERFNPSLVESTPDLDSLYQAAKARAKRPLRELPPRESMRILYETVADRFTHGDTAHYTIFSNWLLGALGYLNEIYSLIQDPDALLALGHSVLCSQSSYVLIRLAGKAGITARFVILEGHVIMEAWYEEGWHAYDVDMEAVPRDAYGTVPSAHDLSLNSPLVRQTYVRSGNAEVVENIIAIFSSRDDNWTTNPVKGGIKAPPLSPWLGKFEEAAQTLIFIIPTLIILIGTGILCLSGSRQSTQQDGAHRLGADREVE